MEINQLTTVEKIMIMIKILVRLLSESKFLQQNIDKIEFFQMIN